MHAGAAAACLAVLCGMNAEMWPVRQPVPAHVASGFSRTPARTHPAVATIEFIEFIDFIEDQPRFPFNHPSTIIETKDGLLAAWHSGTHERVQDTAIVTSRYDGTKWSAPVEVSTGVDPATGVRHGVWNAVFFQPSKGPLLLFYKIGPSPSDWRGMLRKSDDQGRTWSPPTPLPAGFIGPVRNKPVELSDGSLLFGASVENDGWRVHTERLWPDGRWTRTAPLNAPEEFGGAIQPAILMHSAKAIQILCRTRKGVIAESWSRDGGRTWSALAATTLPNPNSAIDAVRLSGGGFLLVYNHSSTLRMPIHVAVSPDGRRWSAPIVLEDGGEQFAYPAVIQSRDGLVHITYSWNRAKIRHLVIDPGKIARG